MSAEQTYMDKYLKYNYYRHKKYLGSDKILYRLTFEQEDRTVIC